jgi:hypothetical protein
MRKHTQTKKVYKYDNHTNSMKIRGCSNNCMISGSQSKDFYNDISFVKLSKVVTIL